MLCLAGQPSSARQCLPTAEVSGKDRDAHRAHGDHRGWLYLDGFSYLPAPASPVTGHAESACPDLHVTSAAERRRARRLGGRVGALASAAAGAPERSGATLCPVKLPDSPVALIRLGVPRAPYDGGMRRLSGSTARRCPAAGAGRAHPRARRDRDRSSAGRPGGGDPPVCRSVPEGSVVRDHQTQGRARRPSPYRDPL